MPFGASGLRALCSTGDPVTFNGVSKYPDGVPIRGLVEAPMAIALEDQGIGGVAVQRMELRLPFNAFSPMPQNGDPITVAGVDYTVDTPTIDPGDDGSFLVYALKATA